MSPARQGIDDTDVPARLWRRSGRPWRGQLLRAYLASTAAIAALVFFSFATAMAVIGGTLAVALGVPRLVELGLRRWERRVEQADRTTAARMLADLSASRLVRYFAPHAWLCLQRARLQQRRGELREAAQSFAEAHRLSRAPDAAAFLSGEAHALVLAGERGLARERLSGLAERRAMSPRDHLDLGLISLAEPARIHEALDHLDRCGPWAEHPRALAARALGLCRAGREQEGYELYLRATARLDEQPDEPGADVLKRARKGLRSRIEAERKRGRQADESPLRTSGVSPADRPRS